MKKHSLFSALLASQPTGTDFQDLVEGLFTAKEIEAIDQRIKIIQMLKAHVPQRDIANKLKVGLATITRGSTELKRGHFHQIKANKFAWRSQSQL